MLSRWYSIFIGIMLLILGIAGLMAPRLITGVTGAGPTLVTTSVIWLITAVLGLYFGFFARSVTGLRWFAGIVGAFYVVWGIVAMASAGRTAVSGFNISGILAGIGGFTLLLGALGLAAALAPAYWLREREVMSPGTA